MGTSFLEKDKKLSPPVQVLSTVINVDRLSLSRLVNYPAGFRFYWSSRGNSRWLALGSLLTLSTGGLSRVTRLLRWLGTLDEPSIRQDTNEDCPNEAFPRFFGGISFNAGSEMGAPWSEFPSTVFFLPRIQVLKKDTKTWVTVNHFESSHPSPRRLVRKLRSFGQPEKAPTDKTVPTVQSDQIKPPKSEWLELAQDCITQCESGSLKKAVLAQHRHLQLDRPLTAKYIVSRLQDADDDCFRFLFKPGGKGGLFTGVSPEKLITKRGRVTETESVSGSIRSDECPSTRSELADQLQQCPKNQREHAHVVQYLKDRLSKWVSTIETVSRSVQSLPGIQHLRTPFRGKLIDDVHVLELVDDLHPTPAVGGYPSGLSSSYLRDREPLNRGYYASPMGWFDFQGNGEFCVGIRSGLIRGSNLHLFAGAGLIDGSNPENEWDEVQLKYRGLLRYLLPDAT